MKKLLILLLVLGISSAANAAIVISADGDTSRDEFFLSEGETVVIGIYNTDGEDYVCYPDIGYISEGGFQMSNPQLTALAGDLSQITGPYEYTDMWEVEVTLKGTSTPGIQFTWDLTLLRIDIIVIVELWDGSDLSAPVDVLTVQEPEPMTLALFGLGGLFLLRRRK
jgi:hypothetical protein